MKYPWTHDEVPGIPSRPSTGMRLLTLVVWGCLFLTVAGLLAFSAGGMIATDSISFQFLMALSQPVCICFERSAVLKANIVAIVTWL